MIACFIRLIQKNGRKLIRVGLAGDGGIPAQLTVLFANQGGIPSKPANRQRSKTSPVAGIVGVGFSKPANRQRRRSAKT